MADRNESTAGIVTRHQVAGSIETLYKFYLSQEKKILRRRE